MARYWCKNCDTEFNFGANGVSFPKELTAKWEKIVQEKGIKDKCPICGFEYEKIPDYETPQQYEKRTGKPYPSNGLVWYKAKLYQIEGNGGMLRAIESSVKWQSQWKFREYKDVKWGDGGEILCVIADPPVPPPDDFVPEVMK